MIARLISSFALSIVIIFTVNAKPSLIGDKEILLTICEGNTKDLELKVWPETECQVFVSCYKDRAEGPLNCPSGTVIDTEKQQCDYPENVTCMDKSPRTTNFDCTRKAVQGLCNNYTECDGTGGGVMKNCGENTVYSNVKKTCMREINLSEDEKVYCNTQTVV